ncbi:DUF58 domain-containing protein [bacterium]|nr:DUF58 domain-containing protein [bacterium]
MKPDSIKSPKKKRSTHARPTKTGWIFLVGSFLLYMASLTSQSGLLLFPIGILVGCFFYNIFESRKVLKYLQVDAPDVVRVAEGGKSSQAWKIRNSGKSVIGMFRIMMDDRILIRVGRMAPGGEQSVVPETIFEKRGVHHWSELMVECFYPFGLLRLRRRLLIEGEAVVYPAVYSCAVPPAAGFDVMVGGKYQGGNQTASGTHFAGVRPSQPGDPLKHIHWKSSSKGLGLMTRTYDEELSGRVALVIDSSFEKHLDDALRAAGSVIFAALDEGHHVELVLLSDLSQVVIPPFTDGQEILDLLARIEANGELAGVDDVNRAVDKVSKRSSLVFVMTSADRPYEDLVNQLKSRGRVLTVMQPLVDEVVPSSVGIREWFYSETEILT